MFVCFSMSHVLVAQILPSSGSGGPLKRFPTPLKRTLIEPMVEIMMQNHQIMTAVDMSMTRTTLGWGGLFMVQVTFSPQLCDSGQIEERKYLLGRL